MIHVRQRTDSIHGTIYLSEFESELTSTPFFYRLHDIYQSSTVYLTFPANRTKRYEHSLGVMALASEMLFASITNASPEVRTAFFNQLDEEFQSIFLNFAEGEFAIKYPYLSDQKATIKELLTGSGFEPLAGEGLSPQMRRQIDESIECVFASGAISDNALNHFSLYSLRNSEEDTSSGEHPLSQVRERFLYQCLLQAVRISALFHDVGHPPYSHIIEDVLTDLYVKNSKKNVEPFKSLVQPAKAQQFDKSLGRFLKIKSSNADDTATRFFNLTSRPTDPLHESAGKHLLKRAVENVMQNILPSIISIEDDCADSQRRQEIITVLYYITSIEFAGSILYEQGNLFTSIHRIIDGTIDADRLDYVPRDSHGCGVDWGAIPYRRLIDSAKLFQITSKGEKDIEGKSGQFIIAYPERVVSDIEDFLLNRYKVFTRINYHHRCVRTSKALASCVEALVMDYLESPSSNSSTPVINENGLKDLDSRLMKKAKVADVDSKNFSVCISPNIHILWTALDGTNGDEALKVLQWNDSWMISVLQSALLRIRTEKNFRAQYILQSVRRAWEVQKDTDEWKEMDPKKKKRDLEQVEVAKGKQLDELQKNLEEFLLNKKVYYSLFKRGVDSKQFVLDVLKHAGIQKEDIEKQLIYEHQVYFSELEKDPSLLQLTNCLDNSNEKGNALDSINRYERLLEAFELGDLKALATIFPTTDGSIQDIMHEVLDEAVHNGKLAAYKVHVNFGWDKTGLPEFMSDPSKDIYLYRDESIATYDVKRVLKPQISALQHSMPWLYVYVRPANNQTDVKEVFNSLRNECAKRLGEKTRERYNELFPNHKITGT